jgi:hypothetical protein
METVMQRNKQDIYNVSDGHGAIVVSKMSGGKEVLYLFNQSYAIDLLGPNANWKRVEWFEGMTDFKAYIMSTLMGGVGQEEYPIMIIGDLTPKRKICFCMLKGFRV